MDRVHRIGQTRPVKATRYITRDSIETVSPYLPLDIVLDSHDLRKQYVQWVQDEKVRLINQSLDVSLGEKTQMEIDEERLGVGFFLLQSSNDWKADISIQQLQGYLGCDIKSL